MQIAAPAPPASASPACPSWLRHAVTDEVAATPHEWTAVLDGLKLFFIGDASYKGLFYDELFQAQDHFNSMAKAVRAAQPGSRRCQGRITVSADDTDLILQSDQSDARVNSRLA